MHLIQFREIMRDAEVAYAIHSYCAEVPPKCKRHDQSPNRMRRAAGCQHSSNYERLDMTADSLTARKTVVKERALPLSKPQSHVDNRVSKNN
jgi:hypothetical protein